MPSVVDSAAVCSGDFGSSFEEDGEKEEDETQFKTGRTLEAFTPSPPGSRRPSEDSVTC